MTDAKAITTAINALADRRAAALTTAIDALSDVRDGVANPQAVAADALEAMGYPDVPCIRLDASLVRGRALVYGPIAARLAHDSQPGRVDLDSTLAPEDLLAVVRALIAALMTVEGAMERQRAESTDSSTQHRDGDAAI